MSYIDWTCPNCGHSDRVREDLPVHCFCGNTTRQSAPPPPKGKPGTELEQIIPKWLARLLRPEGEDCSSCKDYARKMDRWGVSGCEERFDEIVTRLVKQAGEMPLSDVVARRWLRKAIDRAREKEAP